MDPDKTSNNKINQLNRLYLFLDSCTMALQVNTGIVIATDDNIDTNTDNKSHINQTLLTCLNDYRTDKNMTRLN